MKTIKQLVTIIITTIFILGSYSSNAQKKDPISNAIILNQNSTKGFWAGLLADAAGALAGGSAGATIGGAVGVATGGAGMVVIVGGSAVIGGAAASVAYANRNTSGGTNKNYSDLLNSIEDKSNNMNFVGQNHNVLITDFFKKNKSFDLDSFYDFCIKHKEEYNVGDVVIDKKTFKNIVYTVNDLKTTDQHIDYIIQNLPKSIDKKIFKNALDNLTKSGKDITLKDIEEFEKISINKSNELPVEDQIIMNSFYSLLRYSLIYW